MFFARERNVSKSIPLNSPSSKSNSGSSVICSNLRSIMSRMCGARPNMQLAAWRRIVDIINFTPRPPCNLDSAATSKVNNASWSSRCKPVKSLSSVCVLRIQKSWISFLRVRFSIILKLWRDSISVMSFTRSSRVIWSCLRTFRICSNAGLFAITFSPHWVVRTLPNISMASVFQFSFAARTMWAHWEMYGFGRDIIVKLFLSITTSGRSRLSSV